MSTQEIQIQELVKSMPAEAVNKILDYALYVKYSLDTDKDMDINIDIENIDSEEWSFVVKNKEELYKKLEEAEESIAKGDVYSVEEVFTEVNKILVQ